MKILVVEDEAAIRELLVKGLMEDGHVLVGVDSAEAAMSLYTKGRFETYILDVILPGRSGNELCQWLRDQGVKDPILMLTARSGTSDKVEGLDAGADDYLTKPFDLAEIKAHLRAAQRKSQGYPRAEMQVADLSLNPNTKTAARAGVTLELSKKEFALLDYLMRNQGRVVTRPMIAQAVWESETTLYTNVIDVFVAYLRRKIDNDRQPRLIHTIRGKGFLLSATGSVERS